MGAIKTINDGCKPSAPPLGRKASGFTLRSVLRRVETWLGKRRSRLALLQLTDEQLRDVGISRDEARREGLRPFWD
ncbi:DUF1127 domain-containing protein [Nitratireductor rhodophyticola]|uniref:DUF1127 domain-containing protein n=1 Tax=Nitratireductor rhodophyticola TaxID=2854036 RepID=UPI0008141AB3|nr:DUF1127 domain-containing protein [Pseudomonadota bacterium]